MCLDCGEFDAAGFFQKISSVGQARLTIWFFTPPSERVSRAALRLRLLQSDLAGMKANQQPAGLTRLSLKKTSTSPARSGHISRLMLFWKHPSRIAKTAWAGFNPAKTKPQCPR
jgi:hypothetical protein